MMMHMKGRFNHTFCWLVVPYIHGTAAITFEDVQHTFDTLQTWYNDTTGLWMPSTGWWNSAVCLNMLANLALIDNTIKNQTTALWQETFTKAPLYNAQMTVEDGSNWRRGMPSTVFVRSQEPRDAAGPGFLNGFYDDEGWWALAWIAVYDLTNDQQYLDEAVKIFEDIHAAFNTTPVGGVWWDKQNTYVNAIANELHFSVAAHLANRCVNDTQRYVSLAHSSWDWFYASGMINSHNNIKDGAMATDPAGKNLNMVWSYNQGVILGALTELSQATSQQLYITIAKTFADAALANLTSMNSQDDYSLILRDPCEDGNWCGLDGASFKGIFAQNLAKLHQASPEDLYGEFLMKNAEALDEGGSDQYNRLGLSWDGPVEQSIYYANASTQCSGMGLFVGALGVLGEWQGNGTYVGGKVASTYHKRDTRESAGISR